MVVRRQRVNSLQSGLSGCSFPLNVMLQKQSTVPGCVQRVNWTQSDSPTMWQQYHFLSNTCYFPGYWLTVFRPATPIYWRHIIWLQHGLFQSIYSAFISHENPAELNGSSEVPVVLVIINEMLADFLGFIRYVPFPIFTSSLTRIEGQTQRKWKKKVISLV